MADPSASAKHGASTERPSAPSSLQYYLGMAVASIFSLAYFVGPFYMLSAVAAVLCRYPTPLVSYLYALPIVISALLPPIPMPWLVRQLRPMLSYFDYEEIIESSPVNVREQIQKNGKNYLLVFQPHGAVSFCGICSAISAPPEFVGKWHFPTAVADALLHTPLLKHVLGVFGLISASKSSMVRTLQKPGPRGCVVLYVGGMAELFLSCENQERLYLKARKGFIKLALTTGVDVVPIYLFGNTTVLSVLKTGLLAYLSRKLQVSLTYIWGKWYLPIPRPTKLLYVSGQPLGMPKIENPTQADIDLWHDKYCQQVKQLFDLYKERVPEYKHKQLEIL
jgi:Diacylglycerol acyltransferase